MLSAYCGSFVGNEKNKDSIYKKWADWGKLKGSDLTHVRSDEINTLQMMC